MDQIRIIGGTPLKGTIEISGAKNAALPLLTASLLSADPLELSNVPDLADIHSLIELLTQHGVRCEWDLGSKTLKLTAATITSTTAPYDIVRKQTILLLNESEYGREDLICRRMLFCI